MHSFSASDTLNMFRSLAMFSELERQLTFSVMTKEMLVVKLVSATGLIILNNNDSLCPYLHVFQHLR